MRLSQRLGGVARFISIALALAAVAGWVRADLALLPKPALYFNDNAHVVDAGTAADLNEQLAQFERDTSNQILVAIYPSLPDGADASQYSTQNYNAWGVGQKSTNNGAVLFVFINDHRLFIATGRGLEGALPDITCEEIIRDQIEPSFKQGDYAGGLRAGVTAMMAAAKGEYKGTGQTNADRDQQQAANTQHDVSAWIFFAFILLLICSRAFFPAFLGAPYIFSGGGFGGGFGGGWGGGGGGGGGGGFSGFSGGGGSSAGGGAGGSW